MLWSKAVSSCSGEGPFVGFGVGPVGAVIVDMLSGMLLGDSRCGCGLQVNVFKAQVCLIFPTLSSTTFSPSRRFDPADDPALSPATVDWLLQLPAQAAHSAVRWQTQ